MYKIYILLFSLLILASCGNKHEGEQKTGLLSNLIDITDNESKGVDEILDFYGGYCKYSIGFSASTKDGKKKYFELEMSQSDAIDERLDNVHLPSSNVAYIFYKNLKEEKKNYNEIHVSLISKDNNKREFSFPISVLEQVEKRMIVLDKTINLLKDKEFEKIKEMLNNELVPFDKEKLIPRLKEIEPQLGSIQEFLFYGFKVANHKEKKILHLSGGLLRDKQNNEFSIDIDFDSDNSELYQLQYKL
ncbi:hypothetical protein [Aquimarina algiphila]|uniref:hypothetical protein n=1 Tax=Aquimarina algiphila TaxID=2047982 RepID=UPI00248F6D8E|nr:hypothetical protein [Aquimarina algiphila]